MFALVVLRTALGTLLAGSWIYWLLCLDSARRWKAEGERGRRGEGETPPSGLTTHDSRLTTPSPSPPVSILVPVYGRDPEQAENFASLCRQEYPEYEVVFGALDSEDPGLDTAREVAARHPEAKVTIVAGGTAFGANLKVCNLHNMLAHARHDLLVLCDSDMRVTPDYLRRITAPFSDPSAISHQPSAFGLVTCPYRGACAEGLASALEALGIVADFMPSVLLTWRFWGMSFAFGSTIALSRDTLERIGGFQSLADELADDYLLGSRVHALGLRVELSDYVVDDVLARERFGEMWSRRLRWARTTRAMRPGAYWGLVVTHGTALALLYLMASGFTPVGWGALAATLAVRAACATWIARRCLDDANLPARLPLLPLSDLLSFALWVVSLLGSTVTWRGQRFRVLRGGRLVRLR